MVRALNKVGVTQAALDYKPGTYVTIRELADSPDFAGRLGIDAGAVGRLTQRSDRERVAAAVASYKGGELASKIRWCGTLRICERVDGGATFILCQCRQRICPRCARLKASRDSAVLRRFVESCTVVQPLMVTLTTRKRDVRVEGASEAMARMMVAVRRLFNGKYSSGKRIAALMRGGIRVFEMTWSPRGWQRDRRGIRRYVKYSGWHPHVHMLIEPKEHAGPLVAEVLTQWVAQNDAVAGGQHATKATEWNIGEIIKYALKAFTIKREARLAEACEAIRNRKLERSYGEWSGWRKKAPALDSMPKSPNSIRRVTTCGLSELRAAALSGRWLTWDEHVGAGVTVRRAMDAERGVHCLARDPRGAETESELEPVVAWVPMEWLLASPRGP